LNRDLKRCVAPSLGELRLDLLVLPAVIGSIRNLGESLVFSTMCWAMYHDISGQAKYRKPDWLRSQHPRVAYLYKI
jgi:hypothetical protein